MSSQHANPPGAIAPTTGVESLPDDPDDPSELTFYDARGGDGTTEWITADVDVVLPGGGELR